jgi:hypothetical protein
MQAAHPIHISIAFFLILSIVLLIAPRPAMAQGGTIGGIVECLMPKIKDLISSIPYVGDFLNSLSSGKKVVPVSDKPLEDKSCYDAIMTGLLKDVIKLMRDMILNWILTGRFEGPVFSTNYYIDAAMVAENASRIFLSKLSGYNFCEGFDIGATRNFTFNFALSVSCSLSKPIQINYSDAILGFGTTDISFEDYLALSDPLNNRVYDYIRTTDEKRRQEANAVNARDAEHQAGLGFLPIKDKITALAKLPGSSVKELADSVGIKSPVNQTDVANTVQQAISAIIETALKALVNKGFGK